MIHFPLTKKQGVLEAWVAGEIANLAGNASVAKTGYLLLDAQLTDLETRCSARYRRPRKNAAKVTPLGMNDR